MRRNASLGGGLAEKKFRGRALRNPGDVLGGPYGSK